jgi:hypothetical protein
VRRLEQALNDYDAYFGLSRSTEMTLDDYWTQMLSGGSATPDPAIR